jgi:hypothetical protein
MLQRCLIESYDSFPGIIIPHDLFFQYNIMQPGIAQILKKQNAGPAVPTEQFRNWPICQADRDSASSSLPCPAGAAIRQNGLPSFFIRQNLLVEPSLSILLQQSAETTMPASDFVSIPLSMSSS